MRRLGAVLVFALACARPRVAAVEVAPVPSSSSPEIAGSLHRECTIAGTGERRRLDEDEPEFDVFATERASAPSLVIAQPWNVHVGWSRFPRVPSEDARASVTIGGQQHVRFTGWSLLRGRTFVAKKRMYAEPNHLWARPGAPIEIAAVEDGVVVARVSTPFISPTTLGVRGTCAGVMYQAQLPPRTERRIESIGTVLNRKASVALFAAPAGKPFTTVTFESDATFSFDVIERKQGFVHVAAEAGDIGLDAWVRQADVDADSGFGTLHMHGFGTSSHCGGSSAVHGIVARDTPLLVGDKPVALEGAVVETGADVLYWDTQDTYVQFWFTDGMIRAAGDRSMWIAKDAITPTN